MTLHRGMRAVACALGVAVALTRKRVAGGRGDGRSVRGHVPPEIPVRRTPWRHSANR